MTTTRCHPLPRLVLGNGNSSGQRSVVRRTAVQLRALCNECIHERALLAFRLRIRWAGLPGAFRLARRDDDSLDLILRRTGRDAHEQQVLAHRSVSPENRLTRRRVRTPNDLRDHPCAAGCPLLGREGRYDAESNAPTQGLECRVR